MLFLVAAITVPHKSFLVSWSWYLEMMVWMTLEGYLVFLCYLRCIREYTGYSISVCFSSATLSFIKGSLSQEHWRLKGRLVFLSYRFLILMSSIQWWINISRCLNSVITLDLIVLGQGGNNTLSYIMVIFIYTHRHICYFSSSFCKLLWI